MYGSLLDVIFDAVQKRALINHEDGKIFKKVSKRCYRVGDLSEFAVTKVNAAFFHDLGLLRNIYI